MYWRIGKSVYQFTSFRILPVLVLLAVRTGPVPNPTKKSSGSGFGGETQNETRFFPVILETLSLLALIKKKRFPKLLLVVRPFSTLFPFPRLQ